MQKAMYPCKTIRITQKDHEGTHRESFAVDEAGADGGISNIIAPFDFIVKRKYDRDANEVWIESLDKVEYADGTIDYMTIMFAHDNYINDLVVGGTGKQGDVFYQEGTKGQASGNHCHFECGKGKFTGYGWHKSKDNTWNINNGKLITDCLWIDDSYQVIDTKGYKFKKVQNKFGTPVARDEYKLQVEALEDNIRARKTPNGEILGYINKGIYNINERAINGDYVWFEVENNMWIANGEWCKIYEPKPNECDTKIKELEDKIILQNKTIEEFKKELIVKNNQINALNSINNELNNKIAQLHKELENKPTSVFKCAKTGMYKIKLYEDEELFIG